MNSSSKIFVAGHRGLVGSAICRNLKAKGYNNLLCRTHSELDLTDTKKVDEFFSAEKPEYVFLSAAKVGGIMANSLYRADFITINLQIQNNVISASHKYNVKKLLFLGSSCIYPRLAPQPISEDALLTGELEYTNEPYALAKIAGIRICESYNLQYGTDYIAVMPTNLYGPNDNYHLENSHVMPAMIRKMHLAKALENEDWSEISRDLNKRPVENINGNSSKDEIKKILNKYGISEEKNRVVLNLWGTGSPLREFLHVDDMADACVFLMENVSFKDLSKGMKEIRNTHINIGTGIDLTIKELAEKIKQVVGFKCEIHWDATKPDGTPRKLLNVSKLEGLGWKYKISLDQGISTVYSDYCKD